MPNLRRSIVGPLDDLGPTYTNKRGIHLQASDGRTYTVTKQEIVAHYLIETGTTAARKLKTVIWLRQQKVAALGVEQIDPAGVSIDFDENTGEVTGLTVEG